MAMTDTSPEDDLDPVLIEAADWFIRLTSGKVSEADAAELAEWRAQSAEHEAAFRELALQRMEVKALDRSTRTTRRRREVLLGLGGLFTAGATYSIARPPFGLWPSFAELTADHRTGAGQHYTFAPTRGVQVEMNSSTAVSLVDKGAGVTLIRGEAFVAVSRRPRPFRVGAGDLRVETTGARFNVHALASGAEVACMEGTLACAHGSATPAVLHGGDALKIDAAGAVKRGRVDPTTATAWMQGLLIFKGEPLSEVIDQINLYRTRKIILTNSAAGKTSVQGVFHTNQIENAIGQLAQLPGVSLRRLPGGVVLIG